MLPPSPPPYNWSRCRRNGQELHLRNTAWNQDLKIELRANHDRRYLRRIRRWANQNRAVDLRCRKGNAPGHRGEGQGKLRPSVSGVGMIVASLRIRAPWQGPARTSPSTTWVSEQPVDESLYESGFHRGRACQERRWNCAQIRSAWRVRRSPSTGCHHRASPRWAARWPGN